MREDLEITGGWSHNRGLPSKRVPFFSLGKIKHWKRSRLWCIATACCGFLFFFSSLPSLTHVFVWALWIPAASGCSSRFKFNVPSSGGRRSSLICTATATAPPLICSAAGSRSIIFFNSSIICGSAWRRRRHTSVIKLFLTPAALALVADCSQREITICYVSGAAILFPLPTFICYDVTIRIQQLTSSVGPRWEGLLVWSRTSEVANEFQIGPRRRRRRRQGKLACCAWRRRYVAYQQKGCFTEGFYPLFSSLLFFFFFFFLLL